MAQPPSQTFLVTTPDSLASYHRRDWWTLGTESFLTRAHEVTDLSDISSRGMEGFQRLTDTSIFWRTEPFDTISRQSIGHSESRQVLWRDYPPSTDRPGRYGNTSKPRDMWWTLEIRKEEERAHPSQTWEMGNCRYKGNVNRNASRALSDQLCEGEVPNVWSLPGS